MNYPPVKTLTARALARLLSRRHFSYPDFQNDVASYRLSAEIFTLRKSGWPICDAWYEGRTNDPANRKASFKKYFLPEKFISEMREGERQYREKVLAWERKKAQPKEDCA